MLSSTSLSQHQLSYLGWVLIVVLYVLLGRNIIRFILSAFRVHVLWGVAVMVVPVFGALLYLVRHWLESGNYFLKAVLCLVAIWFVWDYYSLIEKVVLDFQHSWDSFLPHK